MTSPRIKICGITRTDDARFCEHCGVDAIGFVFVKKSKRFVTVAQAVAIASELGPFMACTGLFLNDDADYVRSALDAMPGLILQFHGQESPAYCESFDRPYIKAIGIASGLPTSEELAAYASASAFLFDSNEAGELGGTGHSFDWNLLGGYIGKPLILAGGLSPDNVVAGIEAVNPYAVDVSTGVESAPGIKDTVQISEFVSRVRQTRLPAARAAAT